eukprot:5456009-Prymnesium_polylepis.1
MGAMLASRDHTTRESVLTSQQAADYAFSRPYALAVIKYHRLRRSASLRIRRWCLNQGCARATRRQRQ